MSHLDAWRTIGKDLFVFAAHFFPGPALLSAYCCLNSTSDQPTQFALCWIFIICLIWFLYVSGKAAGYWL